LKEARAEKRRKVAEAKSRQWLVVGLDFGTTFTVSRFSWIRKLLNNSKGIAYIATKSTGSGDAQVIKQWSGGGRQSDLLEKCPSRYAYASENKTLTEDAWGYQVQAGMRSYSWFKLLLDEDTDATEYDDPLLRQSAGQDMTDLPPGKTPKELAADYLKKIYKHAQFSLGEVIGNGMVRETPCHYKLTLPATWSHQARERTREAAELAGFGTRICGDFQDKLSMIDEPEAAAIYAIKSTIDTFPDKNPFEVFCAGCFHSAY
jgi:molecular chaperone DnaK (HSP70)